MTSFKFLVNQGGVRSCVITILKETKLANCTQTFKNVTDALSKTAVKDV